MEKLPLDFSQPANRLTAIADTERKNEIKINKYQPNKPYKVEG